MNNEEATKLLKRKGIDPDELIQYISAADALENLMSAAEEYCPGLKIDEMRKRDIWALLKSYGNSVTRYHPEGDHQERGAFLENFEMLKKYGLRDEDYSSIDFC